MNSLMNMIIDPAYSEVDGEHHLSDTDRDQIKRLFKDMVKKHRPMIMTMADIDPFGDDPLLEKAVKIRDQLRKEIIEEIDEL